MPNYYNDNMRPKFTSNFILYLTGFIIVSCNTRSTVNESKTIWPDTLTNGLIRYVINTNNNQKCIFYSDKAPLWFSDSSQDKFINSKTGFTPLDSTIVRKQLEFNRKFEFRIDTANLLKTQFISYDTLVSWGLGTVNTPRFWEIYAQKVHRCFCIINCPIYNIDKTRAITRLSHLCGGKWITWYDVVYKRNGTTWLAIDTLAQ